ncbi:diadenylate cyclase CdaA [Oscillospiraceae bacterium OttesenSCG-928-F05]|nr:diadenylate cyclase CdaA [Oscillospiraceae bacterium OttesenSCG-928-F05]
MEYLSDIFQNVGNYIQIASIVDLADILIVAFLIYKIMCLFRNTTAAQVMRAIAILLVAMSIAKLLEMKALGFILDATMQVGLIALVVVFQPELRRVLERVGAGWFPKLFSNSETAREETQKMILETVDACTDLAKQRIGALIVFERVNPLADILRSGTLIDADVTAMLLKNIFFPKAALHDGAVVIRKHRIAAAGCVLPLTGNVNLSRDLGTRHRAGVGVSERYDAVTVIVSEETGSISVAVGGLLKRHLTQQTLERILFNELLPDEEQTAQKGVKGMLRKIKGNKK